MSRPWLVVIDGQRIFADPTSDWGSPMWPDAAARLAQLLPRFVGRTILTRWVPPAPGERVGSWTAYMAAWPFADRPAADSVVARIAARVAEASRTKARAQLFIEKVEQRYSVGMVVATLAVFAVPLAYAATTAPTTTIAASSAQSQRKLFRRCGRRPAGISPSS